MRSLQFWTCLACGHSSVKDARHSKLFGGLEPTFLELQARARCTKCSAKGRCFIEEKTARAGWGERAGK